MAAATVLDSAAFLLRLARAMRTGERFAPADADLAASAIEIFFAKRGALSLEQAFGLAADDDRRIWPAVFAAHVRDEAIAEYARRFFFGEISAQARMIADEIANYGRRHWPRDRVSGLPEAYCDTPREFLFKIFRFGGGAAPESVKQIRRVLRSHWPRSEIIGHAAPYGGVPKEIPVSDSGTKERPNAARRQDQVIVERRRGSGRR